MIMSISKQEAIDRAKHTWKANREIIKDATDATATKLFNIAWGDAETLANRLNIVDPDVSDQFKLRVLMALSSAMFMACQEEQAKP